MVWQLVWSIFHDIKEYISKHADGLDKILWIENSIPVSIYLVNGIKLQGQIESFDQFVILLKNTVSQMVYKHAISTVVPARNVKIVAGGNDES